MSKKRFFTVTNYFLTAGRASRRTFLVGLSALFLWLGATSSPLLADGTNAAPAHPQPPAAGGEDFGQYLADHAADLAPFFTKNSDEWGRQAIPLVMGLTGWIMFFTVVAGWVIDIFLSRGFSAFFAPIFAKVPRAIIYATGRFILSMVFTVLLGLVIVFGLDLTHFNIISWCVIILFLAVALTAQVGWVIYLYRTTVPISGLFYLTVIFAHSIVGVLIAVPIIGAQISALTTNFVDKVITPGLQAEVKTTKEELAVVELARDEAKSKVIAAQNQIAQAEAEEEKLRQEIETQKNSDAYIFSQIVKVRAQGDLPSARDQLTAFLAKFPSGSLTDSAQEQLTEINNELAVQAAKKKQDEADAAQAAAQAQADLLARAGKGEATLSEMRQALIGKSRTDVSNLLGLPTETASDRWGYGQQMILNPMTNEKYGLTVHFTEGVVQGVDYYYGGASK